jgi:hypothetical protein
MRGGILWRSKYLHHIASNGRIMNCKGSGRMSLSIYFLLLPLWSIGHPWNALFHFSFLILRQSVGLLGRGISPSQGRYLYKHRINTNIHASSEIRTHDPSVPEGEDSSCLRPRGHCVRQDVALAKSRYYFTNSMKDSRKPWEFAVTIAGVATEIRTVHIP